MMNSGPPPPPPANQKPSATPPALDGRAALLEQIQGFKSGGSLKPVEEKGKVSSLKSSFIDEISFDVHT